MSDIEREVYTRLNNLPFRMDRPLSNQEWDMIHGELKPLKKLVDIRYNKQSIFRRFINWLLK